MTRSELTQALFMKQSQLSYKEVEAAVKNVFEQMVQALVKRQRIEVRGFGSFSVRFQIPRVARNPKTGELVQKEGKYTAHFRTGKEVRDRVNSSASQYPIRATE